MRHTIALAGLAALLWSCGGASPQPPRVEQARKTPQAEAEAASRKSKKKKRDKKADPNAKFDFYVLAMSWSPQHCATAGNRKGSDLQCAGSRTYDFVLHGLWPQYEKGWPQDCSTAPVSRELVDSMLDIMPAPGLVRHEWSKHGTCSGMEPKEYFEAARETFQGVKIPAQYTQPKLQVVTSPQEMRKRFQDANPSHPADSFAVACSGRFVQEVRVCYTTDLEPRACSREVLNQQCKAKEVILRPVR